LYKYKGQTQEKQGISFRMGNISFKGSQIDRKYSLAGLQKILDLQQKLFGSGQNSPALNSGRISKKPRQVENPFHPTKTPASSQAVPNDFAEAAMSRAVQILFQTGFAGGGVGGKDELTPEERRRRKKKKRPNF